MAKTITYEGSDAHLLYHEIKRRCSVLTHTGSEYPYNPITKTIESRKISGEHTEVFSLVSLVETKLVAIVPYEVARTLSCSIAGPPASRPVLENAAFVGQLRDYQEDGAAKVIEVLTATGRCYLQAPPAYGKTVLMSYVISHLKEKTLIVVPGLSLAEQTKTSINQMLPGVKVYILETEGGERMIPEDTDVLISFVRRLCGPSAPLLQFKTVILDEVHQLSTTIGISAMLTMRPNHLLALTATPGDRNPVTELFVGKCTIRELADRRWSICFPRIVSGMKGSDYSGVEGYTEAMGDLTDSVPFMTTIVKMVRYFVELEKRVIVITMRRDTSDRLAELLGEASTDGEWQGSPSYAVLTPESRRCPNCDVVIGTHKLIGTGFDLSNYVDNFDGKCASVMIFIGSIKNQTLMYQAAGRGFRARDPLAIYPSIVDLPVSVSHTKELLHKARHSDGCVILDRFARFLESFASEE